MFILFCEKKKKINRNPIFRCNIITLWQDILFKYWKFDWDGVYTFSIKSCAIRYFDAFSTKSIDYSGSGATHQNTVIAYKVLAIAIFFISANIYQVTPHHSWINRASHIPSVNCVNRHVRVKSTRIQLDLRMKLKEKNGKKNKSEFILE